MLLQCSSTTVVSFDTSLVLQLLQIVKGLREGWFCLAGRIRPVGCRPLISSIRFLANLRINFVGKRTDVLKCVQRLKIQANKFTQMFPYNKPTKIKIVPNRQDSRGNWSGCKHNILTAPTLFVLCDVANLPLNWSVVKLSPMKTANQRQEVHWHRTMEKRSEFEQFHKEKGTDGPDAIFNSIN